MVATPNLMTGLVNGLLSIKPLASFAKQKARQMMIDRAALIGFSWQDMVNNLRSQDLEAKRTKLENPRLEYPDYYIRPFHAYSDGNLGWDAASEVEVAAYAVHSRVWGATNPKGDALLRQSYHDLVKERVQAPKDILDLGCSVGMSTLALAAIYPDAKITGLDLSPYFLAIADHNISHSNKSENINLVHAAAESTGLADHSFDLISIFLVCHELPQGATLNILKEAKRLLRPQGHLAIMDMNPQSEIYAKMPPYILTLLKSTEPYLDQYFSLDLESAIASCGFKHITITANSPRHRTVMAEAD
ncbi:methylase involved in ubiquinone/menaquinone biosynthesis [Synechococcus sp. PCC 7502]|uniref:class I SAM-dependent methyltransferase n=1 Tax=Synechococcus sp. PCC 7502 TaxID=1173263 RepID=UPI00029FAF56|nr:class I SAM-dependent methyltransferase [Synechococcus sp. PCC 7502]AFY72305.1 methylase involved in ubiquinone/menaquinone biosynthesis [Synechococcus sp. PCC 7502]